MMENPNWKPTEEDIRFAWKVWIDENAKLEIVPWLRAYANSIDPKYSVGMSGLATEILRRCQEAANDIERLRKLFGDSERLSGRLQETVDQLRERLGGIRIELDEAIREREEARREVCELQAAEANRLSSAVRLKGWICFEETTEVGA